MTHLVRGGLLLGTALVIGQGVPGVTAIGPVRRRFFPGLAGQGRADHVALTFDDGPDPASTPAFLAALERAQVRAAFFMLGPMARRARSLAAVIATAGHEVGVHGWAHRYATVPGPRALHDDLAWALDEVARATGTIPRLYRPPFGVLSAGALPWLLDECARRGFTVGPLAEHAAGASWQYHRGHSA